MSSTATEAVALAFPVHSCRRAVPGEGAPRLNGPRVAAPGVPSRERMRLTRRGRLVLWTLLLTAVVAAALAVLLIRPLTASAGGNASAVPTAFRTVLPGETLWQIAVEVAPRQDPRDTIASILELNALDTVLIQPGQMLAVPTAAR